MRNRTVLNHAALNGAALNPAALECTILTRTAGLAAIAALTLTACSQDGAREGADSARGAGGQSAAEPAGNGPEGAGQPEGSADITELILLEDELPGDISGAAVAETAEAGSINAEVVEEYHAAVYDTVEHKP